MPFAGSDSFLDILMSKTFRDSSESVIFMNGSFVNKDFFNKNGFTNPILIPQKDGLQIEVPDNDFSIPDIAQYVGLSFKIDVIDVRTQDEVSMTMQEFAEYFYSPDRNRLLNVLSMEFSKTNMSNIVTPPRVVSDLSLVETCWPPTEDSEWEEEEGHSRRPSVQKYCLISMANSYTDFHIDFGGSSVWYHVLWGEKVFYLIPPTRDNLRAYRHWFQLPHSRSVFFPDFLHEYLRKTAGKVDDVQCSSKKKKKRDHFKPDYDLTYSCPIRDGYDNVFKMTISTGNTVLLPSGWIHAVYTPVDSIVFGGNFMHPISIPLQLTIYRMEKKLKTNKKFMFPYFEKLHWFVAERILAICKNYQSRGEKLPFHYLEGGKCLTKALNKWLNKRKSISSALERSYYLPDPGSLELSCNELLKQLNKIIADLTKCKSLSGSLSAAPKNGKTLASGKRKGQSASNGHRDSSKQASLKSRKRAIFTVNHCNDELSHSKVKKYSPEKVSAGKFYRNQLTPDIADSARSLAHFSLYTTSPDSAHSSHSTPGGAVISQDRHRASPHLPPTLSSPFTNPGLNTPLSFINDKCPTNTQCAPELTSLISNNSIKSQNTPPSLDSSSKTSTPYSNPYDFTTQEDQLPELESALYSDEALRNAKRKKKKKKKRKKEKVIYEIVRDTLSEASRAASADYVCSAPHTLTELPPPVICNPVQSNMTASGTLPSSLWQ